MLGDVESERDSYREKLMEFDTIKQRLLEVEDRESMLIKNIEDLNVKNNFAQVYFHWLKFRNLIYKDFFSNFRTNSKLKGLNSTKLFKKASNFYRFCSC